MGKRILLVEDDLPLAESLKSFLENRGFSVDLAGSYEEALGLLEENRYDLYLIDVNLGDGDGIELLEDLRRFKDDTPTLIISAMTDVSTIARGFNAGAEDYVKKPFDPEELLVRIKARLKEEEELTYGNITYRGGRFFVGEREVELGEVERCVLLKLLRNRGKVVSKESLYNCMKNPSPLALRVLISKLKKKTGLEIKAVKGVGYALD
ncbi:MAG: response regulator transcription factor [Aquificae bacterium]|nr:response regulator transcription factor [Aquificota bacterium]